MEPLFGLDASTANNLLIAAGTIIATIVAGYLGGRVGAKATRQATEQTLREAASRDEANRGAILRGVLLGIRAEFEQLLEIAEKEEHIGEDLDAAIKAGEGLHVIYPIHQNFFIVYESNAALIGQMPDERCVAIVKTYLIAASLVNALKHNSELELERRQLNANAAAGIPIGTLEALSKEMATYAHTLKTAYDAATGSLTHLFALMDKCELLQEPSRPTLIKYC